jgi:hypothetical protein
MKRPSKRFKALLGVGIILLLTFTLTDSAAAEAPPKHPSGKVPIVKKQVVETYGKLPLSFEANRGQTDAQVKFLSRGPGYTLFLTPGEAVLAVRKGHGKPSKRLHKAAVTPDHPPETTTTVLRMQLVGANPAPRIVGLDALPGKSNYFIGNDPQKWQTNVPHYARIAYEGVYPGIDLVYHGLQRQLEYDLIVAPGADPKAIALSFQGADRVQIDAKGDLVLHTPGGLIRQNKPLVYQEVDGDRQELRGGYVLNNKNRVGFDIAAYDASKPLVIDPVLSYSTYLGGSGNEWGLDIDVDNQRNIYVTGETGSDDFPPGNEGEGSFDGDLTTFVTKLNGEGSALLYTTYLGATGGGADPSIAVDASGNAYVSGFADASTAFPITSNAFQQNFSGGGWDAFVAKLDQSGALDYATYLGGSGGDGAYGIAVDAVGDAYVSGWTESFDFPTTSEAFEPKPFGSRGAFVAKLDAEASGDQSLIYSTYLGGTGDAAGDIAVDVTGSAYVIGSTDIASFPTTVNAFQQEFGDKFDVFVVKLTPAGDDVVYSTFLGGDRSEFDGDIAANCDTESGCTAYVTGFTQSANFPTTEGALQEALAGKNCSNCPSDAFVTKLNAAGNALVYSTYLGGREGDTGYGIAIDSDGNAYVTGSTQSSRDFPSKNPFQRRFGGGPNDAFVAKLNDAGNALVYSSYLGGRGSEVGLGVAVDSAGDAYVTGSTNSTNFPTENAFQDTFGGSADALVTKVSGEGDSGGGGGGGGPNCEKKPDHPKC